MYMYYVYYSAELIIAVGLWPFTSQNLHVTARLFISSTIMAGQLLGKRSFSCRSASSSSSDSCSKKRNVFITTFERWQKQFDRNYQTSSWLRCEKDPSNCSLVSTLFCEVCRVCEDKIEIIHLRGLSEVPTSRQATYFRKV